MPAAFGQTACLREDILFATGSDANLPVLSVGCSEHREHMVYTCVDMPQVIAPGLPTDVCAPAAAAAAITTAFGLASGVQALWCGGNSATVKVKAGRTLQMT